MYGTSLRALFQVAVYEMKLGSLLVLASVFQKDLLSIFLLDVLNISLADLEGIAGNYLFIHEISPWISIQVDFC